MDTSANIFNYFFKVSLRRAVGFFMSWNSTGLFPSRGAAIVSPGNETGEPAGLSKVPWNRDRDKAGKQIRTPAEKKGRNWATRVTSHSGKVQRYWFFYSSECFLSWIYNTWCLLVHEFDRLFVLMYYTYFYVFIFKCLADVYSRLQRWPHIRSVGLPDATLTGLIYQSHLRRAWGVRHPRRSDKFRRSTLRPALGAPHLQALRLSFFSRYNKLPPKS